MDDQALSARVEQVNLFCRVTPVQKNRVILALKRRGHVVGYLGDGINDAPSLHSADVGISVDSAVDVAKAAADMILLKHDLGVLHAGVIEGRRTFGNIMKYIMMGTSSNFGNMFSMAGASLFLPFLPMLPVQILLNNLLYDVSELPIPLDRVDDDYLSHPRHWDMKFIRTRRNPFKSRPNPWLIACSLSVVAAVLLPFTPAGAYLGFVVPPVFFFLILTAMLLAYLLAVELMKRWFFRRFAAE
jgi:Mg2+-importing ATPase